MNLAHVTVATAGRLALALDETALRAVVRAIVARHDLLLFDVVDDHVHAALEAERPALAARGLRWTLEATTGPGVRWQAPHVQPIEGRRHLERLVGYLLEQPARHELPVHPALWTGSCFLDLVGARRLAGFDAARLRAHLPRLRERALREAVGLGSDPLAPAERAAWDRVGPRRLVELASATVAAGPDLRGRSAPVVAARALAARIAQGLGLGTSPVARALGVTPRAVRRLASRPADRALMRAIGLRYALEERVRAGAGRARG